MSGKLEKTSTGYYRANQGFATTLEGQPYFIQNQELVHKNHPLLKGREDLFEPADQITRFDDPKRADRPEIEQATAAPGEKRGRRSRKMSESEVADPEVEAPAEEPAPEEPAPEEEDGDEEAAS